MSDDPVARPEPIAPEHSAPEHIARSVRIEGRVQGVGYRAWTVDLAHRRGVRGWVRNRSDGSVEALFIGPPDAVAALIEACHHGPKAAKVTTVRAESVVATDTQGFRHRPTE